MIDIEREKAVVASLESNLNHLTKTLEFEKRALEEAELTLQRTQNAQEIIQLVAQAVQQQAHEKISSVVTRCLKAVFGDEAYEFKIEFERKRGRTEAKLLFTRQGLAVDPLTASGGGVVDVAAFALRVACLMLHRPRLSKFICLDEPFRFVSLDYQPQVRSMLEQLARDLKLQIVFVSHNENLATGQIIEV